MERIIKWLNLKHLNVHIVGKNITEYGLIRMSKRCTVYVIVVINHTLSYMGMGNAKLYNNKV